MNASPTSLQRSEAVVGTTGQDLRLPAAEIDASCRGPLLLFFTSAVLWLILGTILALIASIKLHGPGFLADYSWLTLGRVRPAAMNSFLYGFASQAGIGVMLWLLCRLGGVRLAFHWPLVVAWKLWNLGVMVGVIGILIGMSTGFEWLEMPRAASAILFVAYAIIGICAVTTFAIRRQRELFPTQWYLLAAIFWFPWIYSAASYLLVLDPVRGTFQAAVNAWYTGNFVGLWLTPIGLAGIFYFLPRLCNQPLYSRELAIFGFWTLAFFANFAGLTGLIGGPLPRWMTSVSTAANVCLLVPLISNAINWHLTCSAGCEGGNCQTWRKDFVLLFVMCGAVCYLLNGVLSVIGAVPQVASVTNFTYAVVARHYLILHGFVGMVLFGSLYYIVPRLVQIEWPNQKAVRAHFYCSVAGVVLIFIALTLGGVIQGLRLANPEIPFISVVKGTIPFVGMSTLGLLLLLVGQFFFVSNLIQLLRAFCEPVCSTLCAEYCDTGVTEIKAGVKS
jgi:cytochrome c oxidase cbb3-type subunit I